MNTKTKILAAIMLSVVSCQLSVAQSTNSAVQNWFQQVESWATSIDTNNTSTFIQAKFLAETGVESVQNNGVPIDNIIRVSYDLVHPSYSVVTLSTNPAASGFALGFNLIERDSGVQGTFVSGGGGLDAGYIKNDLRADLYLNGGYSANNPTTRHYMFGEIGLELKKALGKNTFMFIGFDEQFPRSVRVFSAGAGFTL